MTLTKTELDDAFEKDVGMNPRDAVVWLGDTLMMHLKEIAGVVNNDARQQQIIEAHLSAAQDLTKRITEMHLQLFDALAAGTALAPPPPSLKRGSNDV